MIKPPRRRPNMPAPAPVGNVTGPESVAIVPVSCLTAAEILTAPDVTLERVDVPEWGGSVYVKSLTAKERDDFEITSYEASKANDNQPTNVRARLAAWTIADQAGNRLFADKQVEALGRKSGAALDRVYTAAARINGMTQKDIEELEKN